jgi:hypothetical protein
MHAGPNRAVLSRTGDEEYHQIATATRLHGVRRLHHRLAVPRRLIQVYFRLLGMSVR